MSKDPAFLFYPNDYIGGTMGMTFEEKGAYIELLMLQFNRGHMTSQVAGQVVGQLWVKIQDKFKIDAEGLYYNERLDLEIEKRKSFVQSRFNNLSGKNQYSKKEGHKTKHMTSHMEDVNVNENKNQVYNELLKKVLQKNSIILPEGFKDLILEWLKYKSEKNQSYKETGLLTLIRTFLKDTNSNAITGREMLDHSMSKNYSGLFKPTSNGINTGHTRQHGERTNDYWDR